jgi:hypothetical protein
MQQRSKYELSTIERLSYTWFVQSGYEEEFVVFPDASLPGYELGSRGIELSRVFGIGSCRIMARKELVCEMKTSSVM